MEAKLPSFAICLSKRSSAIARASERVKPAPLAEYDHDRLSIMPFSEIVVPTKVSDIQSWRMHIRVESADGTGERFTLLSPALLKLLRNYWRMFRPATWLFPSATNHNKPVHEVSPHRVFRRALELAGLPNRGGISSLRHSFAVHVLESGTDAQTLQAFLGHRWIVSTTVYLYLMRRSATAIRSPLDLLHIAPSVESEVTL